LRQSSFEFAVVICDEIHYTQTQNRRLGDCHCADAGPRQISRRLRSKLVYSYWLSWG
jgi:hypothetical protein